MEAIEEVQPCGARRRGLPGKNANWECDGTDLIAVMSGPGGIPAVAPRSRMAEVRTRPGLPAGPPFPYPFTGGDHYHLTLPEAPLLYDRADGRTYRLTVTHGVLGTELVQG